MSLSLSRYFPRLPRFSRRALHALSVLAVACSLLLAGCGGGKVSEANYNKITNGMTEADVEKILGKGQDQTANIANLPGAPPKSKVMVYSDKEGEKSITVFFVNGKSVQKTQSGL